MPAFLISKSGSDDLETVVFTLDNTDSQDEGIPVFTSQDLAREWMSGSEFESGYDGSRKRKRAGHDRSCRASGLVGDATAFCSSANVAKL